MNLINDPWIPIIRRDGTRERIAPWQVVELNNPVVDIAAPRPDFTGALHQFLIGLLQVTFAPADAQEWAELFDVAPEAKQLQVCFAKFASAFEWCNEEGISFLQDFDVLDDPPKPLASLLIEAPGGKTLKDNLDHFVKGDLVSGGCESCAATALFTLQANAPSGGVGHRVSLRGGGPLTTLLLPETADATLWQRLWLNVRTEEDFVDKALAPTADVFPWMAPTRVSDKKGVSTLPDDVSPLQMYWGMPRRIQLEPAKEVGDCTFCGLKNTALHNDFRTKNYGVDYNGPWVHSLTPYRFDPKNVELPLSIKGQQGGLGYRHWINLNWTDDALGDRASLNVKEFYLTKQNELDENIPVGLWAFGFDMDNMKARCWYEQKLPVLAVPEEYRELFFSFVAELILAAKECLKELRSQIKAAWFSRPKDAKGDTSMIDGSFWEATESAFYQQLHSLAAQANDTRSMPSAIADAWHRLMMKTCMELFDYWVLEGDAEDLDMKRITQARRFLGSKLPKIKPMKALKQSADAQVEGV